jgi:hypothetical protein
MMRIGCRRLQLGTAGHCCFFKTVPVSSSNDFIEHYEGEVPGCQGGPCGAYHNIFSPPEYLLLLEVPGRVSSFVVCQRGEPIVAFFSFADGSTKSHVLNRVAYIPASEIVLFSDYISNPSSTL